VSIPGTPECAREGIQSEAGFHIVEGNYLAGVGVTVKNAAGKTVIEHTADGPFFMAKLPAGTYSVSVVDDGKAQTRKVAVGTGACAPSIFAGRANRASIFRCRARTGASRWSVFSLQDEFQEDAGLASAGLL